MKLRNFKQRYSQEWTVRWWAKEAGHHHSCEPYLGCFLFGCRLTLSHSMPYDEYFIILDVRTSVLPRPTVIKRGLTRCFFSREICRNHTGIETFQSFTAHFSFTPNAPKVENSTWSDSFEFSSKPNAALKDGRLLHRQSIILALLTQNADKSCLLGLTTVYSIWHDFTWEHNNRSWKPRDHIHTIT